MTFTARCLLPFVAILAWAPLACPDVDRSGGDDDDDAGADDDDAAVDDDDGERVSWVLGHANDSCHFGGEILRHFRDGRCVDVHGWKFVEGGNVCIRGLMRRFTHVFTHTQMGVENSAHSVCKGISYVLWRENDTNGEPGLIWEDEASGENEEGDPLADLVDYMTEEWCGNGRNARSIPATQKQRGGELFCVA